MTITSVENRAWIRLQPLEEIKIGLRELEASVRNQKKEESGEMSSFKQPHSLNVL